MGTGNILFQACSPLDYEVYRELRALSGSRDSLTGSPVSMTIQEEKHKLGEFTEEMCISLMMCQGMPSS
jgi:hypothetical protein